MLEGKWERKLRDIGVEIVHETPRSTHDSVLFQGNSVYLLLQSELLKLMMERYGMAKEDLEEALARGGHRVRAVSQSRAELVFTFIVPSDPLKKAIPE